MFKKKLIVSLFVLASFSRVSLALDSHNSEEVTLTPGEYFASAAVGAVVGFDIAVNLVKIDHGYISYFALVYFYTTSISVVAAPLLCWVAKKMRRQCLENQES